MQLSPSTVSTILAVLSVQGVNVTGDELRAALAPLTGETPPAEIDLRPGEFYLLWDQDSRYTERYNDRKALDSALTHFADMSSESGYNREVDDMASVYVVRREVNIQTCTTVKLT